MGGWQRYRWACDLLEEEGTPKAQTHLSQVQQRHWPSVKDLIPLVLILQYSGRMGQMPTRRSSSFSPSTCWSAFLAFSSQIDYASSTEQLSAGRGDMSPGGLDPKTTLASSRYSSLHPAEGWGLRGGLGGQRCSISKLKEPQSLRV